MRFYEIINEGRDALLYHGYGKGKYASMALSSGKMAATSTQRFWGDGRRRREKVDPDYEDSYWMKGISFTRDMHYAMQWGEIVIAVNQAILTQRTKVVPFSWGYHMSGYAHTNNRREREEFAVVKATPDTYNFPDDHEERPGEFDSNRFQSKGGQIEGYIPLTPILEGIWMHVSIATTVRPGPTRYDQKLKKHVSDSMIEKESHEAAEMAGAGYSIQQIIDHPKFKGFFSGGRRGDPVGFKFYPPTTPRNELPPSEY